MRALTTAGLDRGAMAARRQKRPLGTKARDALELLTAALPSCPEPLLLAHGLKIEMLADLVRKGLATAQTEAVIADGAAEVIRFKITSAGRRALQGDDGYRGRQRTPSACYDRETRVERERSVSTRPRLHA
jgi:hypothetical protein